MMQIQIIGDNRIPFRVMRIHDIMRNIKQMLAPFKRCIEASEADTVPQMDNYGI